jgi:glutamine synthetase
MTPEQVVSMVKEKGVKMVDLRFMDFPGMWQHFSVPVSEFDETSFEDGFGFDGSSIRGWQPINASDMLVIPDPTTAKMDPFYEEPTLVLIGNIVDPITRESYTRDPRHIAQPRPRPTSKAPASGHRLHRPGSRVLHLRRHPLRIRPKPGLLRIDSVEGTWNTGRDEGPNLATNPATRKATSPCRPPINSRICAPR